MKNFIFVLCLSLSLGTILTINSCKKATTNTTDDSTSTLDNNSVSNAVNATTDDAAAAAGEVKSFSGKTEAHWWNTAVLCGASAVDTGTPGNHLITITYDGTSTCNGITRSGTVTVSNTSGIPWKNAGAIIQVTFTNLKITDLVTNSSYTLNGTHTITNETGGLAWRVIAELDQNTTVTHRHQSSDMTVTFDDGSQRTWNVDRTRSWSSSTSGSVNTITVTVSSENGGSIDSWGTNRNGKTFTNVINSPISANNNASCTWKPYTGKTTHTVDNRTATILYGTNSSGQQIGSATTCGDGFYVTFTKGTRTTSVFKQYR